MGKDRKRWKKMQKDRERCEKMGKDSGCIVEHGFSCDAANTHMLLNRSFPYLWGGSRSLRGVFSPTRHVDSYSGGIPYFLCAHTPRWMVISAVF